MLTRFAIYCATATIAGVVATGTTDYYIVFAEVAIFPSMFH
jgi:hypothetical protein